MAPEPQNVTYDRLTTVDGNPREGTWHMVPGGFVNEYGYSFVPMTSVIEARSETARTRRMEEQSIPAPQPGPADEVDQTPVWQPPQQ